MIRVWSRCRIKFGAGAEVFWSWCMISVWSRVAGKFWSQYRIRVLESLQEYVGVGVCSVFGVRWKENFGVSVRSRFWSWCRQRLESAQDQSLELVYVEKFGVGVEKFGVGVGSAQDQSLESMYDQCLESRCWEILESAQDQSLESGCRKILESVQDHDFGIVVGVRWIRCMLSVWSQVEEKFWSQCRIKVLELVQAKDAVGV